MEDSMAMRGDGNPTRWDRRLMAASGARLGALLPKRRPLAAGTWRLRHFVVMGLLSACLPLLAAAGAAGGHGLWAVVLVLTPVPAALALGFLARRRLHESQRAAAKQLREAEHLKAELIAIVSHEFRTPLTSILGYAQTLSARINAIDQAGALLFAGRIEREAKRLSRLVHNLLVASGDVQVEPGLSADLREVAEEVADELQEVYPAAGDGIDVRVPRNLRAAIGAESMHQIVTNLVDNALKFSEDGTAVKLRGRREYDRVVLEVANVGPPIPIDARERIFQPFVQLDSSDTRSFDGIGMGLPIVRKLLSTHQGAIHIRSDGRLIVFRVSLPSAAASGSGAFPRSGASLAGADVGERADPATLRAAAG
ncbi:MAG: sensor histidine kinase [Gemmatimonadales bacterium]